MNQFKKTILFVILLQGLGFVAFAQEGSIAVPVSEPQTGQLRRLASVNTQFIPQSLIPDEGLLTVQTQFYLPDRRHTVDRKVFSLNQQSED